MKKPLKLPDFSKREEVRSFLKNTDLADYLEPSDLKKIRYSNLKPTKRLLSLRLEDTLIQKAKRKAAKLHIPYQTLMRQILYKGLETS